MQQIVALTLLLLLSLCGPDAAGGGKVLDAVVEEDPQSKEDVQATLARSWGEYNRRRKGDGELESESGPGSSLGFTVETRAFLESIIARHGVRTIVDVGCGDFHWMQHVDLAALGVTSYVGIDVNEAVISKNQVGILSWFREIPSLNPPNPPALRVPLGPPKTL